MSARTVTQTIETALARLEVNDVYLRELDTRYYLIDPVLRALKWDLSDPAQVSFEFQIKNGKIDYVLFNKRGSPVIYVEAKRADVWLGHDDIIQLREYVRGKKQGLAILTNGTEWKIFGLSRMGRFDSEKGKKLADMYFDLPERFSEEEDWDEWEEDDDEEWGGEEDEGETAAMPVGEVAKLLYQYLDKQKHW